MPLFRGLVSRFPRFLSFGLIVLIFGASALVAQSGTNSGTVTGTVTDGSGAVVAGAKVSISNPVSGYSRTAVTDGSGRYQFSNLPFNPYHLAITAQGFDHYSRDVEVRATVAVVLTDSLKVGAGATTITVDSGDAGDLLENDSTFHTDVDRNLIQKLPLESQSSALSSLVTLSSPGVAADSNGLFHGLGDHASNSFSIDGQSITDQQSKVFSNQLPSNSVQSIEVISGAPPAEYGGKTALVIQVTTRSGQGVTTPTGSITASYGTFGSATGAIDLSYGGQNWGNFIEVDGLNTGRFLDPPEFRVFHDKGNEENIFDRVDRSITPRDSVHLDLNYSRSWFQTPNTYDSLNVQNVLSGGASDSPVIGSVGNADQRSQIGTFNIAPTYTRVINASTVFNFGPYVRRDAYNYYPSANPLADKGAPNLQTSSIAQYRTLTNAGAHADVSYSKGANNVKVGANYAQTFLRENDSLGIVDPTYNAPCVDGSGNPIAGYSGDGTCGSNFANPAYLPVLGPYDLTRGGSLFHFTGGTDVKEFAIYAQDQLTLGNWLFNLGLREDVYNGLTSANQTEPRLGTSYKIKKTNTVLRVSYARTLESPFNENLVLSSEGCLNAVLNPLLACSSDATGTLKPGFKNEFHAGLQQGFGKNLVISGDYIWKYTHNAFDFSVLGNTPITFPIDWHNSKIPGFALRADVPNLHGLSAYVIMSSVAARFFPPQVAGAGATVGQAGLPFRIDHDEKFNQTTHLQYQTPFKMRGAEGPWIGFNWRYDSGLTAGSVPCYNNTGDPNSPCGASALPDGTPAIDLSGLTADEQAQAGLMCDGVKATPSQALPNLCPATELTSNLVKIPAPNTENDDKNPPRIAPRNLFDASIGDDNLFHGDKQKWSLKLTAVNVTNKYALYNFLSTFSGTHYVTPRAMTAEIGFHF
jgi:hypothetical protein